MLAKFLLNRRGWMLALLAGSMPLGTVATCDYSGGGGTFFLDRSGHGDDGVFFIDDGHRGGGFVDFFIEDDVYYEDDYYIDEVFYEDDYYDDDYYCDPYFWDCW
ncbi:MAG: hypothetical protein ACYSUI_18500 [Planctomycetota bacterium]|jgi:hypothetical protein